MAPRPHPWFREAAEDQVSSLPDLVEIARRLHAEDMETGAVTAVTQLMAAAASKAELGRGILDRFEKWINLVEEALKRALGERPMTEMIPTREAAYAISAAPASANARTTTPTSCNGANFRPGPGSCARNAPGMTIAAITRSEGQEVRLTWTRPHRAMGYRVRGLNRSARAEACGDASQAAILEQR